MAACCEDLYVSRKLTRSRRQQSKHRQAAGCTSYMQEPDKAYMRLAGLCGEPVQMGLVCLHQAPAQSMLLMHWS